MSSSPTSPSPLSAPPSALPAYETKSLPLLSHPFGPHTFHLTQAQSTGETGSTLWLSGQVLAAYLCENGALSGRKGKGKKVLELGSGIGYTALALASMGSDVMATDQQVVLDCALLPNVKRNAKLAGGPDGWGRLQVAKLDWAEEQFSWEDQAGDDASSSEPLKPPFDFIITTDTFYHPPLTPLLLRTLHTLSTPRTKLYVALERRDPALIDDALRQARGDWGFDVRRVDGEAVRRAVRAGLGWGAGEEDGWEGVEVWKFARRREGK